MWVYVVAYVIAFVLATAADAGTTLMAMASGAGQEFNAAVSDGQKMLHLETFAYVNGAVLVFSSVMLVWALLNRSRIAPRFIAHPMLAAHSIIYFNPFSPSTISRSPLHYIALAPALVLFKLLVATNNALINMQIPDLLTPLAMLAVRQFGEFAGYWIVIALMIVPVWLVSLYMAAGVVRALDGLHDDQLTSKRA